jgi:hypothetical protein
MQGLQSVAGVLPQKLEAWMINVAGCLQQTISLGWQQTQTDCGCS